MNWDDFRYFSALARTGSVRTAARELGVNASTVTRRLDALEQALGVLLFTRSQKGLQITAEGAEVVQRVDLVGEQLHEIQSTLKGRDQRLVGRVRIAVPDVLAVGFLLADLAPFAETYPDIDLELIPGYQNLDLSLGEADVLIRATDLPPENMIGRPLSTVGLAAYSSRQFATDHDVAIDTAELPWVDWARSGEVMKMYARLRAEYFPKVHVHIRCDQVSMQHACVRAHMGLGILPCYVGDGDEALMRLPQMPIQASPTLWLLTHPDLRGVRRVQVFMEYVRDIFVRREQELIGTSL